MQGVEGGGERPKVEESGLESDTSRQMRQAGLDRAQAEDDGGKKGVVEQLQENTAQIKDFAADKMDKMGAAVKSTFTSAT